MRYGGRILKSFAHLVMSLNTMVEKRKYANSPNRWRRQSNAIREIALLKPDAPETLDIAALFSPSRDSQFRASGLEANSSMYFMMALAAQAGDKAGSMHEQTLTDIESDVGSTANNAAALSFSLAQAGRVEEAIVAARAAIAQDPTDANLQYNLGTLCLRAGQLPEAVAALQESLRLDPELQDAYFNLGLTFEAQGAFNDAITCYKKCLAVGPDADADIALERVSHARPRSRKR